MAKNKIIILSGMPGAGKGSISAIMKWQPNVAHTSTGDLLRALDPESDLGRQVFPIINAGKLLDDDTVNKVMEPAFVHGRDILLDGYPRTVGQSEYVLDKAAAGEFDVVAILLEINEETAELRRQKRINDCLMRGEQPRKDDVDPTILPKRFAEYREKTEPTIEFLRQKLGNKFFAIDGTPTIEDVYSDIMKILTAL